MRQNTCRRFANALIVTFALGIVASAAFAATADDARFNALAGRFIERYLATNPETATSLGEHRFDKRVSDFSRRGTAAQRKLFHTTLAALEKIPAHRLSAGNAVDLAILQNALRAQLFEIDVLEVGARDPLQYNPSQGIYALVARDFAPLKGRLESVRARLIALPAGLAAAKRNLQSPPRVFTETAIQRNKGTIALVRDDLEEFLKAEPSMRTRLAAPRKRAIAALESFGGWLEKDLLPRSSGDFRIGPEAYRQKLRFAIDSELAPEVILASAEADLRATQAAMLQTALPLYRSYLPDQPVDGIDRAVVIRAVLDKLAETHPDNATIVDQAKKSLAAATDFVRARNLVTVPDDPVKVIVMPEFNRGFSVAYCDAAGPLEKNGATFYAISPTPADWTAQRTASFFREYNHAMVNDLTVHEAMPGHYLQLIVANKSGATTKLRGLFGSGTFIEGWATYAEQIMADAGFGGPETRMQQLKMRLRMLINAIIDQKIHAGNMSEQEAMAMMMQEGFQEDGEAAGKWRRAQLSSTQLATYYVGNLEINALSRDLKAKSGGDMKAVHDRMLSFGSITPKHVRQLLGL
jgi:uncharacterized protein (DUF885 family)